jgi:hypothetical protein
LKPEHKDCLGWWGRFGFAALKATRGLDRAKILNLLKNFLATANK